MALYRAEGRSLLMYVVRFARLPAMASAVRSAVTAVPATAAGTLRWATIPRTYTRRVVRRSRLLGGRRAEASGPWSTEIFETAEISATIAAIHALRIRLRLKTVVHDGRADPHRLWRRT